MSVRDNVALLLRLHLPSRGVVLASRVRKSRPELDCRGTQVLGGAEGTTLRSTCMENHQSMRFGLRPVQYTSGKVVIPGLREGSEGTPGSETSFVVRVKWVPTETFGTRDPLRLVQLTEKKKNWNYSVTSFKKFTRV